ncbi:DUF3800 domain-containing protein [Gimesia chilikensis]|uniref:DUF3800 domain-containing protein n=1 Tax=Gimesia chilikensis TaxID=2605989 RepID=UPI00118960F1|nr:DUF3800 domain-containing protein [Gimesia chilikensis]QDT82452.1 hypothetical protein MalM14_00790 [Gimesia chilikensis]
MTDIFLDESGYTGTDLLNPDQPVFALASLDLTEEECKKLKSQFFGNCKATELKSTKLMRKPRGQHMILKFLAELKKQQENTRISYVHKPFGMLTKAVDWIVEPFMRRRGINLYEQGGNLVLSNIMFKMLESMPDYRDRLLKALYDLMSDPRPDTAQAAMDVLAEKTGEAPNMRTGPVAEMFQHLYFALLFMDPEDASYLGKKNLELCLTLAKSMMGSWSQKLGPSMVLYHDQSSNMANQADEWEAWVSPEVEDAVVGYDRRVEYFPIGVTETKFVPSTDWAGIQLADVLVGVVVRCIKVKYHFMESDAFTDDLWEQFQGWSLCCFIGPEGKFTPEELNTNGPMHMDPMKFGKKIFKMRGNR